LFCFALSKTGAIIADYGTGRCCFQRENASLPAFTSAGSGAILELKERIVFSAQTAQLPADTRGERSNRMSMLAEFSVVPIGTGVSISPQIAKVLKIVAESGITYKANPMGTVLEGDWDSVLSVIKKCHDAVMSGSERALTTITIDDRRGKESRMEKKLESVEQKLGMKLKT